MDVLTILRPLLFFACLVITFSACTDESEPPAPSGKGSTWDRGRAVYMANCIACHNSDPTKEGPIGPAIKGAPQELIEARLLRSSYPLNYKPKRNSKVMPNFPFLKPEIPYLAAYLQ